MIRPYETSDLAAVLDLNAANVPEVGQMDDAKFTLLRAEALSVQVVDVGDSIVGFMILLSPGGSYASPNYVWFSERYSDFVYVDRIALSESVRGQGWGPEFYRHFQELTEQRNCPAMLAEVNTVPANPRSLRFHERFGFEEVARCRPYGGDEEVAMLAKHL